MARDKEKSIGASFQAQTKFRRGKLPSKTGKVVATYKVYADPLEVLALPAPKLRGGRGLWSALATVRENIPEGGSLSQQHVSQILWATAGLTYGGQRTRAGALSRPGVETYLMARQIDGIFPGVYHYNPREHCLEYIGRDDSGKLLASALVNVEDVDACAAILVYTGIPSRVEDGARSRAYRYLYLEAGSAAQCAVTSAVGLDLVASVRAEFYDDEVAQLLQVDGLIEFPLCCVTVGT